MFKKFNFVLLILLLTACEKSAKNYSDDFNAKNEDFQAFLKIIENKSILNKRYHSLPRIVLINCNKSKASFNQQICDDKLLPMMDNLHIREINIEKEYCDSNHVFDKVYFMKSKSNYYPIVYYLYDYCGKRVNYESKTIIHNTIRGNWSLLIDKNRP